MHKQADIPGDENLPNPAGKAVDEPRLPAGDLLREIGDAEDWDEASREQAPAAFNTES